MKRTTRLIVCLSALSLCGAWPPTTADARTALAREGEDGSIIHGRTMKWGTFDLNPRIAAIPRGYAFVGTTLDGKNGHAWSDNQGVLGLDMLESPNVPLSPGIPE